MQWLASSLANINGQELPGIVSYDAKLIRAVKNFQKSEGLTSDGIAGVQTLIRINSVTDKNVPRLTAKTSNNKNSNKQSATAIDLSPARIIALLNQSEE